MIEEAEVVVAEKAEITVLSGSQQNQTTKSDDRRLLLPPNRKREQMWAKAQVYSIAGESNDIIFKSS
jgi:hypothetical protein